MSLNGLDASAATEIFPEKELLDEDQWQSLIFQYRGHPFWLKIVASTIRDLLSGRVSELLKYESLFLDESFKEKLNRQFDRLSDVERKVIIYLNTSDKIKPI